MIETLEVSNTVMFKNSQYFIVYKIIKDIQGKEEIYGLAFDPHCIGNFDWYYKDGSPVTWWAEKSYFDYKTIVKVLK